MISSSILSRPRQFFFAPHLAAAAFLLLSNSVQAVVFQPVSQSRTVHMFGELNSFNFETQDTSSAVFNDSDHGLPEGWDPLRMGMDISLLDGNCFGQGVASQTLVAGGRSIEFSGLADVNISGIPAYPVEVQGNGGAVVDMQYTFHVASPQQVELVMDSGVRTYGESDYLFSFKSDRGAQIWGATGVVNEDGEAVRSFKRRFTLDSGDYTLTAQLNANSYLSGSSSFAGRTWANFSVTAVPEPSSLVMWLSAIGLIALRRPKKGLPASSK